MYLMSIDVGIKNLAYCLLFIDDNKICKIIQWDILNLAECKPTFCQGKVKKTGLICGKISKYEKNNSFFCKSHAKTQTQFIIPTIDMNLVKLKRSKLLNIKQFADKYSIKYNTPIRKPELLKTIEQFFDTNLLNSVKSINSSKIDLITLGKNIIPAIQPICDQFPIDIVLIENQISPLASRMKTLQGMITQFFIMNSINSIHFISSINKLKHYVEPNKRRTYNDRKKLGIHITGHLLQYNTPFNTWLNYFCNNKKKDDLADSLLQAIWYIESNNLAIIESNLTKL
jgi:hypothetical protein